VGPIVKQWGTKRDGGIKVVSQKSARALSKIAARQTPAPVSHVNCFSRPRPKGGGEPTIPRVLGRLKSTCCEAGGVRRVHRRSMTGRLENWSGSVGGGRRCRHSHTIVLGVTPKMVGSPGAVPRSKGKGRILEGGDHRKKKGEIIDTLPRIGNHC